MLLVAVALAAARTVEGEAAAAMSAVVAVAAAMSVAAEVAAAMSAMMAAVAVEATAAEAHPHGLRYTFVAGLCPRGSALPASPSRLGLRAMRSRLGLRPRGSALPTHNNQTA